MARSGGLCGAVSGGLIAIGLIHGRSSPAYDIDPCYQAVQEFLQRFSAQYKSLSCLELTGIFLDTPEGQAVYLAKGQMQLCTNYVGDSARLVVDILDKMDHRKSDAMSTKPVSS